MSHRGSRGDAQCLIAHSTDRLECMVFGMGDYAASQGMSVKDIGMATYPGDVFHYPRYQLTIAARAAGMTQSMGPMQT